MKRKRQTRFAPIQKVEGVGGMVAGDRRKFIQAHREAMQQEALIRAALFAGCLEVLQAARQMLNGEQAIHARTEC